MTVSSSPVAVPANVALSGMGFDFTTTVSGTSSLTVASGQTADYAITINPVNGAQGSFTYSCGALPANAVCQFNPPATAVSAGATGNVTVEIETGVPGRREWTPGGWRMLPLTCGLLLLPLALRWRRKGLLLVVLLAVMAATVQVAPSSGGGPSGVLAGTGSGSGTPAGTYTIPVTVSSTGISHASTVTITVD